MSESRRAENSADYKPSPEFIGYACDMCEKRFDTQDQLQQHNVEMHTGRT